MGGACNCDCNDGQHELYQEQFNQVNVSKSGASGGGYIDPNTLKPIKRDRNLQLKDESDVYTGVGANVN